MKQYEIHGNPCSDIAIIRILGKHETEFINAEMELIRKESKSEYCIITVLIDDWDRELTPWKYEDKQFNRIFGGYARETLDEITKHIIPDFEAEYANNTRKYYMAGYSLAGLFTLWAAYETDMFKGVAAVSPSLWYPGWDEYVSNKAIKSEMVYLSLGKQEHKTKNRQMACVLEAVNRQYDRLKKNCCEVVLKMNEGNHFSDVTRRIADGEAYIINHICMIGDY